MPAISRFHYPIQPLPRFALVRQQLPRQRIDHVRVDVREKLTGSGLLSRVRRRAKIAITGSSRGIGGFVDLLHGICDALRSVGAEPLILPSMGSHGGATAGGQIEILKRLGVDEADLGAEIRATMETRVLGESETGAVAHIDEIAATSDGIIILGRPKAHPENKEGIASGLLKMTTVGLGKQTGAQQAHTHGLWNSVRAVPKVTLARAPILCGVAAVENSYQEAAIVEVVPPTYEAFKEADERLLEASKPFSAELPFNSLDVLVVDRLGKDISGTGMDLNIIGDWRMSGGDRSPDLSRIAVLSLTEASLGNGLGIGLADLTTQRFAEEFDWETTYINLFTATEPGLLNTREGQLPLALPSDREAIEAALFSSLPTDRPHICRIKSTGELDEFWVSEAMLDEVARNEDLSVIAPPGPLAFDSKGNLF